MSARPIIVWFRDDLRCADHPALHAAVETGAPVIGLYVLDEHGDGVRAPGAAQRWWLHHSLAALRESLAGLGIPLVLRRGLAAELVPALVAETDAAAVHWNRRYSPARVIDARLKEGLRETGVEAVSHPGDVLAEPQHVRTASGTPYKVFTPFWNGLREYPVRPPLPRPDAVAHPAEAPAGDELDAWGLLPTRPDWAAGLRATWTPGEEAALARLEEFADGIADYRDRDLPAADATSRLSPRLRWGELSPAQVWHRIRATRDPQADELLRELGWRDFFRHTLFHEPRLATRNLRPQFDGFPWSEPDPAELHAWQRGRTGIPLVDADEASNPGNWQWVAGSGQDAAPYFRIFSPERQAARFDPDGAYRRRWLPEWGTDAYPAPIVDLAQSRLDALAAYESISRPAARR